MPRVAADEIRVEVELQQLRVVVQHFFEMRHEPLGVDGITRKPAAQLIVNPVHRRPFIPIGERQNLKNLMTRAHAKSRRIVLHSRQHDLLNPGDIVRVSLAVMHAGSQALVFHLSAGDTA